MAEREPPRRRPWVKAYSPAELRCSAVALGTRGGGALFGALGCLYLTACGQTASNDPASVNAVTGGAGSGGSSTGVGNVSSDTASSASGSTATSSGTGAGSGNGASGSTGPGSGAGGSSSAGDSSSAGGNSSGGGASTSTNTFGDVASSAGGAGQVTGALTTATAAGGASSTTTAGLTDCLTAYQGPVGGPRVGGPAPLLASCESISDEVILSRYRDETQKVPEGLYWEPAGVSSVWEAPCSDSLESTLTRAAGLGEIEGSSTSDWAFEVNGCLDDTRRIFSTLRCDYFDGNTLVNGSYDTLTYLVSLLWWMDNGNIGGSQILGYTGAIGDFTDTVQLCTIKTTFGDFGVCDQITLEQWVHRVTFDGAVTLGEPSLVRSITGQCN